MRVPSITVLAAALMVSTAALGAPRETPSASHVAPVHEQRVRFIMQRARTLPLRPARVQVLEIKDGGTLYTLVFDGSQVSGAPREFSSGVVAYPGQSLAEISKGLDDIARELQVILDNVAAGRPWNARVTPMQEISSSF